MVVSSPDLPQLDNSVSGIQKLQLPPDEATRVGGLAKQLEEEFKSTSGKTVRESLTGTLDDSSQFHRFAFARTIAEQDPARRRELALAHLALDLDNNPILRTISPYGDQLDKSGQLKRDTYPGLYHVEQMIPDGGELAKGHRGEKLVVSFKDIKDGLLKFTDYYLEMYKFLEGQQLQPNLSREQVAVVMATQRVIDEYFGFPNEHSPARSKAKYVTKKAELSDFKGDRSAVCTERGALAQQLLSYAGEKVRLIAGGPLIIPDENGEIENSNLEGHVFQILEGQAGLNTPFIYDPANPIITRSESDPSIATLRAYLAPLDAQGFKNFINGVSTEVKYSGTDRMYSRD